jgi:hypothetical protein
MAMIIAWQTINDDSMSISLTAPTDSPSSSD